MSDTQHITRLLESIEAENAARRERQLWVLASGIAGRPKRPWWRFWRR